MSRMMPEYLMALDRPDDDFEAGEARLEQHLRNGGPGDVPAASSEPAEPRTREEYYETLRAADASSADAGSADGGSADDGSADDGSADGSSSEEPDVADPRTDQSGWDSIDAANSSMISRVCGGMRSAKLSGRLDAFRAISYLSITAPSGSLPRRGRRG
jgi:hypothetical protein